MKTFLTTLALLCLFCFSTAQDNMLDKSFGDKGKVITVHDTSVYKSSAIRCIVLQSDEKIIALGDAVTKANRSVLELVRYFPDGKIDLNFGNNGFVYTDLGSQSTYYVYGVAEDIKLQSDGKIIVLAELYLNNTSSFKLLRYNPNGSLDVLFGNNGILSLPFRDYASILLDTDDNIFLSGRNPIEGSALSENLVLSKLSKNGLPDASFGVNGSVFVKSVLTFFSNRPKIVWDKKGNIVMSGITSYNRDIFIVRFLSNGEVDSSFNTTGFTVINPSTALTFYGGTVIQENNKIVIGGSGYLNFSDDNIALCRVKEKGIVDKTFGTKGFITTDFTTKYPLLSEDELASVIIQDDNKIISAGEGILNAKQRFQLARYTINGALDSTYGSFGLIRTIIEPNNSMRMYNAIIQPDSKVIAAGSVGNVAQFTSIDGTFLLIRYNKEKPDTSIASFTNTSTLLNKTTITSVYPNPVNNTLFIKDLNAEGIAEVAILNSTGSIVLKKMVNVAGTLSLDIRTLTTGVYFVQVTLQSKKETFSAKFIKD